ncbi:MAG: fatty acid desaturase, partial [bacterium]|nr:fatty acid desaturase [bacterium]
EYVVNVCERGNCLQLIAYFLFVIAFPGLVLMRFILAPLTFISRPIREFTLRRLSSFTFNWRYERTVEPAQRFRFAALELACCARALIIPGAVLFGVTEPTRVLQLYLLGASVVMLNQLRQLADHHFEGDGERQTMSQHVQDSCNYVGRDPLTWLMFPFSIQYHALHHLFPSLPYHNLAFAHQHLLSELPADSPYRDLTQPGWWSVASKMLRQKLVAIAPVVADSSQSRSGTN